MRLIFHSRGGYEEGASGTTFNRNAFQQHNWCGRWGDYYASQRYPRTWKIRKWLKKITLVFTELKQKIGADQSDLR